MTTTTKTTHSLILGLVIAGSAMGQPTFRATRIPDNYWAKPGGRLMQTTIDPTTKVAQCSEYKNGAWNVLSTPGYSCYVKKSNKAGQYVGYFSLPAVDPLPVYPWLNLTGAFIPLQPPGVTYPANITGNCKTTGCSVQLAEAKDINDHGDVLGMVTDASGNQVGFVYSGGQYRILKSGGISFVGGRINIKGDVVGTAVFGSDPNAPHAAIFSADGSLKDLGTLGGTTSYAYDINSSGQVTGCSNTPDLYQILHPAPIPGHPNPGIPPPMQICRAYIYDSTGMHVIAIDGANYGSQAISINDAGDVVGAYDNEFDYQAQGPSGLFYYQAGTLNRLTTTTIADLPAGLTLVGLGLPNNDNQIVVSGKMPDGSWANFLLVPAASNPPSITSVVNGASFQSNISAGSWISIQGGSLSDTTRQWKSSDFVDNKLPTELDGISVTVNGIQAYPYYVSPTQLNVLTPDDATTGPVKVQVTNGQGTSNVFTVKKDDTAPAFFVNGSKYAAGAHTSGLAVGPAGLIAGGNFAPAQPGETIQLFGTGFGSMSPSSPASEALAAPAPLAANVTVTIGGQAADVTFAGAVSNGLNQLNVTVPTGLPDGDAAIVATVNGISTQSGLAIAVQH